MIAMATNYIAAHVATAVTWIALGAFSVLSIVFGQVDSTQVALALIGAVASIVNTFFLTRARREHRDLSQRLDQTQSAVTDTKRKVGADQRETDHHE